MVCHCNWSSSSPVNRRQLERYSAQSSAFPTREDTQRRLYIKRSIICSIYVGLAYRIFVRVRRKTYPGRLGESFAHVPELDQREGSVVKESPVAVFSVAMTRMQLCKGRGRQGKGKPCEFNVIPKVNRFYDPAYVDDHPTFDVPVDRTQRWGLAMS